MDDLVGIALVMRALRRSEKQIKSYMALKADPIPVHRSGQRGVANKFDLGACVDWWLQRRLAQVTGDSEGPLDYTAERAKLAQAQRIKTQLETEVLRSNLIPREEVDEDIARMASNIRARFASVPSKVAAILGEMTEAEIDAHLTEEITEAMNELSVVGVGAVADAAATHDQRVGRRHETPESGSLGRAGAVEHGARRLSARDHGRRHRPVSADGNVDELEPGRED